MNKSQMKGIGEKVKDKINEAVGKVRGEKAQAVKGKVQQGAGEAQKKFGDAQEQVKKNNR